MVRGHIFSCYTDSGSRLGCFFFRALPSSLPNNARHFRRQLLSTPSVELCCYWVFCCCCFCVHCTFCAYLYSSATFGTLQATQYSTSRRSSSTGTLNAPLSSILILYRNYHYSTVTLAFSTVLYCTGTVTVNTLLDCSYLYYSKHGTMVSSLLYLLLLYCSYQESTV